VYFNVDTTHVVEPSLDGHLCRSCFNCYRWGRRLLEAPTDAGFAIRSPGTLHDTLRAQATKSKVPGSSLVRSIKYTTRVGIVQYFETKAREKLITPLRSLPRSAPSPRTGDGLPAHCTNRKISLEPRATHRTDLVGLEFFVYWLQ
jgi:hypothetical protein